jgi:hypothetical protein
MDNQQVTGLTKKQKNRKKNRILLYIIGGTLLVIIAASATSKSTPQKTKTIVVTPSNSNKAKLSVTPSKQPKIESTAPQTTSPAASAPSCYTAAQAASEEGQTGCVQYVGYAYTSSRGEMYLDQSTSAPYGFSAYIPAGTSFGPSVLNQYSGQEIDVTGSITPYDGEPEIVVTSASQIQVAQ